MLLGDAKEVDSRITIAERNIKSDFIVGDTEIINGLEIMREINNDINPSIITDEVMEQYNSRVEAYFNKKKELFIIVPSYRQNGISHGLMIVDAVRKTHVKQKLKGNK